MLLNPWIFLLFLSGVVAIEIARASSIIPHIVALGRISRRAGRVVSYRKASDHWKERGLQAISLRLIASSLRLGLDILMIAAPIILVVMIGLFFVPGIIDALLSVRDRIVLIALMLVYAMGRYLYGRR